METEKAPKGKKRIWKDARGQEVPEEYVPELDKRRDAMVQRVFVTIRSLEMAMIEAKLSVISELEGFLEERSKAAKVKGQEWKGNLTLASFDGKLKIERSMDDQIGFSEQLPLAKTVLDEWMRERLDGVDEALGKVISSAFNVDKHGRINTQALLKLMRLDIKDKKWLKAMALLKESITVISTRQYMRFIELVEKDDCAPEWRSINLNFSSISLTSESTDSKDA